MRRSTYLVVHPDGRTETLDRDTLVALAASGGIDRSAQISIGGGRPRAICEHPAFGKYFEDAPKVVERSPLDAPARVRSSGVTRGPEPMPEVLGSPSLRVSGDATGFDEETLALDAVTLRDLLWSATPEQVVGCRPEVGRSVVIRASGLRQRQLRDRIEASGDAAERIRLEEAARCVDAAMRVVSQPGRWRSWQDEVRVKGGDTSLGAFANVLRGDVRATGSVQRLGDSGATRRMAASGPRRKVARGPEVLGREMLAAAGVAGFETEEVDAQEPPHRTGERRAVGDASKRASSKVGGVGNVPDWLKAPARLFESGRPTEGPLVYGVGTEQAAGKAVGITLAMAFGLGGLLAFAGPGAAAELTPEGLPLGALVRLAVALLAAALVLHVVRKETPARVGWPVEPQDAMIACGAALPGLLLFALLRPLPLEEGAALGLLPVALLLRAVAEWALFDLVVTRTLLVETTKREAAIAAGALLSGLYALTYAQVWSSEAGSPLHALFWALAVGLPSAWSVYRSGSALPALVVRAVIVVGGAIVGTALL